MSLKHCINCGVKMDDPEGHQLIVVWLQEWKADATRPICDECHAKPDWDKQAIRNIKRQVLYRNA